LLFVIYINDIQDGKTSKINIFVDATKMANRADNRFHTEVLVSDLKKLEEWSTLKSMKFNIDKCSVIHCGRKNLKENYYMYGVKLSSKVEEKDLGVVVSSDMSRYKVPTVHKVAIVYLLSKL